ncbi:MAG: hypothetical protein HS122_03515 [Opitutaceae bacterium]|nr:hypothetical protein [Opitutaceae bacterium]
MESALGSLFQLTVPAQMRRGLTLIALVAGSFTMDPSLQATPDRAAPFALTPADIAFLDELQRSALRFFIDQTDAVTGLTRDRCPADGTAGNDPSSIAAVGFALSAWCIADQHGWLPPGDALRRARTTLRFAADSLEHEHGWFYHFVDIHTGKRAWASEASTIDTAILLKGALLAREYFHDAQLTADVNHIYSRIDWKWAMNGGTTLTHGWWPETGFIPYRWDSYSEMLGLYLLGIGASDSPLPPDVWHAWNRGPVVHVGQRTFIQCAPLFTHQYAHGWFNFRNRRDLYADYWQNSVNATLAQRDWCAAQKERFPYWSHNIWGLTASDSARGYIAWGTPVDGSHDPSDGTIVPCAPGGSLPFAPRECLDALMHMRALGGKAVWKRYGFVDAFNPQTGWTSSVVIGIDVGITLVMAENLRTGLVWNTFMRAPEVQRGLRLAGFHETSRTQGSMASTGTP